MSGGYRKEGAGYLGYKGYHKFDDTEPKTINPQEGIKLAVLSGPSPETLFKMESKPNIATSVQDPGPCEDIDWTPEKVRIALIKSAQHGYKTRTDEDGNLTGMRDFGFCQNDYKNMSLPTDNSKGLYDSPTTDAVIDANVINQESARYRWGRKEIPPTYGASLPGAVQLLQQGHQSGQIIWSQKHAGSRISGRYAGYNAAKYAENGMISSGVET